MGNCCSVHGRGDELFQLAFSLSLQQQPVLEQCQTMSRGQILPGPPIPCTASLGHLLGQAWTCAQHPAGAWQGARPARDAAESVWGHAAPIPAPASPLLGTVVSPPIPVKFWPHEPSSHAGWAVLEEEVRSGYSSALLESTVHPTSSHRALVAWSHHSLMWTPLPEGMGWVGKSSPGGV